MKPSVLILAPSWKTRRGLQALGLGIGIAGPWAWWTNNASTVSDLAFAMACLLTGWVLVSLSTFQLALGQGQGLVWTGFSTLCFGIQRSVVEKTATGWVLRAGENQPPISLALLRDEDAVQIQLWTDTKQKPQGHRF